MKYEVGYRIVNGRHVAKSCMQRPWIMLARIKGNYYDQKCHLYYDQNCHLLDDQKFHCGASIINRVINVIYPRKQQKCNCLAFCDLCGPLLLLQAPGDEMYLQ